MKKLLSLILAAVFLFSMSSVASAKALGDVNGDLSVNSMDALLVLQYSVGTLKTIDKNAADVNGDNSINSLDALIILQIAVGTYEKYKATFKLTAKVGSTTYDSDDVISVKAGNTVYVTLSLSNNYYTGPTSAQIYYNKNIFSSAPSAEFNKNGRFYSIVGASLCTFVDWDKMATLNKENCWPDYNDSKLAEFKSNHKFLRITMTPDPRRTSTVEKSINENLVTVEFKVSSTAKKGTTGQIIIPIESRRTRDYLDGHLMCSVFENEDISSGSSPYVNGLVYDCSRAVLNFKVA